MQEATPTTSAITDDDDARLASLGYKPQLNRVLGLFSNFSVAFTYLSPMVGDLLAVHVRRGHGRPRLRVADLDPRRRDAVRRARLRRAGQPLPGRRRALPVQQVLGGPQLRLVRRLVLRHRAARHGRGGRHRRGELLRRADAQLVQLEPRPDEPLDDPGHHAGPAADPDDAEHHRRLGHGPGRPVRRLRRDPRHVGLAIILAIHGFHHGLGYLFTDPGRAARRANPLGLDFGGSDFGAR